MKEEKGQTLVVVAVSLVVLVAFLGLVVDLGNAYWQKIRLQNAADAAALAGAVELRSGGAVADVAKNFAFRNGAENCEASIVDQRVLVRVGKNVPTFFAGVVGVYYIPVSAEAEAEVELLPVLPTATPGPTPFSTPTPTPIPRVRLTR